jgi:hypothetical protein
MERDLKSSSSIGGSLGLGIDASCGPQFASENGSILLGAMGNFTKDSRDELMLLLNVMPKLEVPLR